MSDPAAGTDSGRFRTAGRAAGVPGAGIDVITLLGVTAGYWLYVTVSDILYAHTLSVGFSAITTAQLIVPWKARLLQHVVLYPALVGCLWLSLRVGWEPLLKKVPVQLITAAAFAAVASPILWTTQVLLGDPEMIRHFKEGPAGTEPLGPTVALWLAGATSFFFSYAFAVAAINGFSWYRRFRDSELRVAALESDWHSARLSALRMQLSPHTLFNLLHTIRGQISWDPRTAQAMVVQLADLLRRLLSAGERDFSRLGDELQFVRLYLELQQRRFADRLTVVMPDPDAVPVVWAPSLILQPLAENAVVHGLAGHEGPVVIAVEARVAAEVLTLRVTNTVSPTRIVNPAGIGIRNVRERLEVQFGDRATLHAGLEGQDQWIAEISMPALAAAPAREAVARPRAS